MVGVVVLGLAVLGGLTFGGLVGGVVAVALNADERTITLAQVGGAGAGALVVAVATLIRLAREGDLADRGGSSEDQGQRPPDAPGGTDPQWPASEARTTTSSPPK